jgi:hypothetical protein
MSRFVMLVIAGLAVLALDAAPASADTLSLVASVIGHGAWAKSAAKKKAPSVRLLVNNRKSAKGAASLSGQVLSGQLFVLVQRKGARSAKVFLDRKPGKGVKANGALRVRKGNIAPFALATATIADGKHTLWVAVKLGGGKSALAQASFRVANNGPSTRELIEQARARRRIDLGTSLLYRLYDVFGHGSVPSSLRGSPAEDDGVVRQTVDALRRGSVTSREAKQLRRFVARPTSPSSIFALTKSKNRASARSSKACNFSPWVTKGNAKVRAWENAALESGEEEGRVKRTLAQATQALADEKPDMREPLPDSPTNCKAQNPSSAIDVYLVDFSTHPDRGKDAQGNDNTVGTANGVTVPVCKKNAKVCSGYVLLNLLSEGNLKSADELDSTLVHELYHVLQMAHTIEMEHWFTEASATWAKINYRPQSPASQKYLAARFKLFQARSDRDHLGTSCTECQDSYNAFIWPLFMSQEGASVGRAWDALRSATENTSANKALDSVFSFKTHFRDFAVRALNEDYHEQGSSSPGPRFQTGTKAVPTLPKREPTPLINDELKPAFARSEQLQDLRIPGSLNARYVPIELPSRNDLRQVHLDFAAGTGSDFDVDALVHVVGQPDLERRRLDSKTLDFCRDDQGDDIDTMVIVLSNHTPGGTAASPGFFTYSGAPKCISQVKGNLNVKLGYANGCEGPDDWTGTAQVNEIDDPNLPPSTSGNNVHNSTLNVNGSWKSSCNNPSWNGSANGSISGLDEQDSFLVGTRALFDYSGQPQGHPGSYYNPSVIWLHMNFRGNGSEASSDCPSGSGDIELLTDVIIHPPPGGGSGFVHVDQTLESAVAGGTRPENNWLIATEQSPSWECHAQSQPQANVRVTGDVFVRRTKQ